MHSQIQNYVDGVWNLDGERMRKWTREVVGCLLMTSKTREKMVVHRPQAKEACIIPLPGLVMFLNYR